MNKREEKERRYMELNIELQKLAIKLSAKDWSYIGPAGESLERCMRHREDEYAKTVMATIDRFWELDAEFKKLKEELENETNKN